MPHCHSFYTFFGKRKNLKNQICVDKNQADKSPKNGFATEIDQIL